MQSPSSIGHLLITGVDLKIALPKMQIPYLPVMLPKLNESNLTNGCNSLYRGHDAVTCRWSQNAKSKSPFHCQTHRLPGHCIDLVTETERIQ